MTEFKVGDRVDLRPEAGKLTGGTIRCTPGEDVYRARLLVSWPDDHMGWYLPELLQHSKEAPKRPFITIYKRQQWDKTFTITFEYDGKDFEIPVRGYESMVDRDIRRLSRMIEATGATVHTAKWEGPGDE